MAREETNAKKLERLIDQLGRAARGRGSVYLTGGATAVMYGWRETTVDADLRLDPEAPGIFEALARLKESLNINIELASPADFIPELPGWREHSVFIGQRGDLQFFHYDLRAQVLAKIERGHARDLDDAREMVRRGLVAADEIEAGFRAVESQLVRFPSIDPVAFREKLESFVARMRETSDASGTDTDR